MEAPGFIYLFIFCTDYEKKACISKIERGSEGVGVDEAPKNGTQNKTEEKQRRAKMEAGGDAGACFTIIL